MRNLPSPSVNGFIGGHIDTFKSKQLIDLLQAWSNDYNGLYRVRLFNNPVVVVARPDLIKQILKSRPDVYRRFSRFEEVTNELSVNGLFSAEGEQWHAYRKLINPLFTNRYIKNYYPCINKISERAIQRCVQLAQEERIVDCKEFMTEYTLDVICNIAFDYDVDSLSGSKKSLIKELKTFFSGVNRRIVEPLPFLRRLYKSPLECEFETAIINIVNLLKQQINNTRKIISCDSNLKSNPKNMLQALIVEHQERESDFTESDIVANIFTILLASVHTTAQTLSWLIFDLATHKEPLQRVKDEVDSLTPEVFDQWPLPDMPELSACLHESMRLHHTAPVFYHQPLHDIALDEHQIPARTMIVLLLRSIALNGETYADPQAFNPARWHTPLNPSDLLLFGYGPRVCPGRSISLLEIKLLAAKLIQHFDIDIQAPESVKAIFDFIVEPSELKLKLKLRN